ncbi:chemotaxis protein CheW [Lyngbya aestuarii]|uniref:chemotaxis protein CheW n=1 Tax=Lyngbya aestuarii TaxID=118322 RepID=UPI00403DF917
MAVFSPLSSRRSTTRKAIATQQLIIFRLCGEGFALPIRTVHKVIPVSKMYGASRGVGVSLTLYQDQELLVIDVEHRIFRQTPSQYLLSSASDTGKINQELTAPEQHNEQALQSYILIVESSQGKLVGLPLEKPPYLQRVPESAFTPLTPEYIAQGNIRCVSALVLQENNQPPLFLLNPDKLVQSQQALPPAFS